MKEKVLIYKKRKEKTFWWRQEPKFDMHRTQNSTIKYGTKLSFPTGLEKLLQSFRLGPETPERGDNGLREWQRTLNLPLLW